MAGHRFEGWLAQFKGSLAPPGGVGNAIGCQKNFNLAPDLPGLFG